MSKGVTNKFAKNAHILLGRLHWDYRRSVVTAQH